MGMKFTAAGVDMTQWLSSGGYSVKRDPVYYEEGSTADGTWHGTRVADKATVKATFMAAMSNVATIMSKLDSDSVSVTYTDPKLGDRTCVMRVVDMSAVSVIKGSTSRWGSFEVTMKEV